MPADSERVCRVLWLTQTAARLAIAALVSLTLLLGAQLSASADGGIWCITDPVVNVAGQQINILVAIPAEYQASVTGPVSVQIATAPQVPRSVVATDGGLDGYGEQVQFVDLPRLDSSLVIVSVQVPLSSGVTKSGVVPVRLTLVPAVGDSASFIGGNRMTLGRLWLGDAGVSATSQQAA